MSGFSLRNHTPGPDYAAEMAQFFPAAVTLAGSGGIDGGFYELLGLFDDYCVCRPEAPPAR